MIAEKIPAIESLSIRDKFLLANELWEEIEAREGEVVEDDAVIAALEERHAEYLKDPTNIISWEALKAKLNLD